MSEKDAQNREKKDVIRGLSIGIAILGMVGLVTYMILMKWQISTLIYRKSNSCGFFYAKNQYI